MDRRGFVRVAAAGAVGVLSSQPALASLSRAVRLDELVSRSRHVVVGDALDFECRWEHVGARKHIVTYTRVKPHDVLAGQDPPSELMIRTLGGQVGEVGELVHGEATLLLGARSVLFCMPAREALVVTAMAQGHYPLARDRAGAERLLRSPAAVELLNEDGSAVKRLSGLRLSEARALLTAVPK
jgi:hypothetical protein